MGAAHSARDQAMIWAKGDLVKVQCGDETVEAEVVLASANGR
jgi:hypothetical protein